MYTTISNLLTVLYVLPISLLCTTVKLFGINIYVLCLKVEKQGEGILGRGSQLKIMFRDKITKLRSILENCFFLSSLNCRTYDSSGPVYNRFHKKMHIVYKKQLRSCHFRAQECPGPPPPTGPRNPFGPMKSIIHGARRIIGQ
jgi:hypothetical protein